MRRGSRIHDSSAYISLDSWVYPELTRLYSIGYLDTMFLSMRPYTRRSVLHMLEDSQQAIMNSKDDQAQDILAKSAARTGSGEARRDRATGRSSTACISSMTAACTSRATRCATATTSARRS